MFNFFCKHEWIKRYLARKPHLECIKCLRKQYIARELTIPSSNLARELAERTALAERMATFRCA